MTTYASFEVMENFIAEVIPNSALKNHLLRA